MKLITLIISLPLLLPLAAAAGTAHESCLKEEKELRAQEKDRCSGFRYLLDPSGCFSVQKALKEYEGGRCREIGTPEKVPAASPTAPAPEPKLAPQPAHQVPAEVALPSKAQTLPPPEDETARLKDENVRLRGEIERLRGEIERLRK